MSPGWGCQGSTQLDQLSPSGTLPATTTRGPEAPGPLVSRHRLHSHVLNGSSVFCRACARRGTAVSGPWGAPQGRMLSLAGTDHKPSATGKWGHRKLRHPEMRELPRPAS